MVVKNFKYKTLYIIFIMIIMFCPRVFADEMNVSNKVRATYNGTAGTYLGLENYNYGQSSTYSIGTRYNGRLSKIDFYLNSSDWNYNTNTTYTITLTMATDDWRNQFMQIQAFMTNDSGVVSNSYNNLYVSNTFRFISYKKIKFDIRTTDVMLSKIKFTLWSGGNSYYFTGVNNWALSSITIADQITVLPTPMPNQPTPTPIPDSSQAIIDNQSQNTQDIIDNNNQNTADIIENNNQNTQNIIDNQKTSEADNTRNTTDDGLQDCGTLYKYNLLLGKGYYSNGTQYFDMNTYYVDDYIPLAGAKKLVLTNFNDSNNGNIIIYDSSKNFIDYWGVRNQTITLPSNASYFRYSTSIPTGRIFKDVGCTSKLDALTDDNVDSGVGSSFFNDFSSTDNGGISAIVSKPLVIVNNLLSNNNQCTNLILPEFLGVSNAYFPSGCILWDNAPSSMITIWNTIVCGFASYFILKDIFKIVENLKNPDNDKVEVMDL